MKVTVDANILFSGLLAKGITRKIWFVAELKLYAPTTLLTEFYKYSKILQERFKGTREEFEFLYKKLLSCIQFVTDSELKPYVPAASSLINDSKDWLYLACALKEDTVIWSNDKELKKQERIKVYSTTEMKKEFGTLS